MQLGQRVRPEQLAALQLGRWLRAESQSDGSSLESATRPCLLNRGLLCIGRTFRRLTSRLRQNRSRFQCCLTEKSPLYECPYVLPAYLLVPVQNGLLAGLAQ